jgi:anti-sigma factor RsiW
MTCRELTEFLHDYVAGNLDAPTQQILDQHIAACGDCAVFLDSYRKTIRLGRAAFDEPQAVVAKMPDDLVRAILKARRG